MELEFNCKIPKGQTEKINLPNLKEYGLIPKNLKFNLNEIEVSLNAQNNQLFKYGQAYFHIYSDINLESFKSKLGEGEDLILSIKNNSNGKGAIDVFCKIKYDRYLGNIIYYNTIQDNFLDTCLQDISDAGLINNLVIKSNIKIQSLILDPIFKLGGPIFKLGETSGGPISKSGGPIFKLEETSGGPISKSGGPIFKLEETSGDPISKSDDDNLDNCVSDKETPTTEDVDYDNNPFEKEEFSNWMYPLEVENEEPNTEIELDLVDFGNYTKFLKFYKLKINFDPVDLAEKKVGKENPTLHILAYGFNK